MKRFANQQVYRTECHLKIEYETENGKQTAPDARAFDYATRHDIHLLVILHYSIMIKTIKK